MPRAPSQPPTSPSRSEGSRGAAATRRPSASALPAPSAQPITARLAASGSRRAELEALLHAAPPGATPTQLRALVLDENVAGKRSAASRAKVWGQLKHHYVLDARVPEYRALVSALEATSTPSDRGLLLFLMLARADRMFREVTLASVSPRLSQPGTPLRVDDVQATFDQIVGPARQWTQETRITARQHVLSALKDFGVLQGGTRKTIARTHPGSQVALFAARLAQLQGLSPRGTLASPWFRLLGLDVEGAWDLLHEAGRAGVLRARRQADVVELELPPLPPAPADAA